MLGGCPEPELLFYFLPSVGPASKKLFTFAAAQNLRPACFTLSAIKVPVRRSIRALLALEHKSSSKQVLVCPIGYSGRACCFV